MAAAAITLAKLSPNADTTFGNKKVKIRTLTFTGDYATGGVSLTASDVGLKKIQFVEFSGVGAASDVATANALTYDYTNSKVVLFESGASGAALAEKTNAETVPTGLNVRAVFIGY